jgi:hypothetical protein
MICEWSGCTLPVVLGFRFCARHLNEPRSSKFLRRRMEQRQITHAELEQALATPETQYQSKAHPGRTVILGKTIFGGRLKVVVRTDNPAYVVTVADRDVGE